MSNNLYHFASQRQKIFHRLILPIPTNKVWALACNFAFSLTVDVYRFIIQKAHTYTYIHISGSLQTKTCNRLVQLWPKALHFHPKITKWSGWFFSSYPFCMIPKKFYTKLSKIQKPQWNSPFRIKVLNWKNEIASSGSGKIRKTWSRETLIRTTACSNPIRIRRETSKFTSEKDEICA